MIRVLVQVQSWDQLFLACAHVRAGLLPADGAALAYYTILAESDGR